MERQLQDVKLKTYLDMANISWMPKRVDIVVLQDTGGVEVVDKVASILLLEMVDGTEDGSLISVKVLEVGVS